MVHNKSQIFDFYVQEIVKLLTEAFEAVATQAKVEQKESGDKEIADLHYEISVLEDEIKWLEGRK